MKVGDEMILYLCVKHKVSVLARWLVGAVEMMPKITGLRFKEKQGAAGWNMCWFCVDSVKENITLVGGCFFFLSFYKFSVDVRLGIKVLLV